MNEEALEYSFNLFKADGYNGTLEDYKALIKKDKEALSYSYGLFSSDGYNGSIEDFSTLVGVGNQQDPVEETANAGSENQAVVGDFSSAPGSSVSVDQAIINFENRTGRKPSSTMELTDEDFANPPSPNNIQVDISNFGVPSKEEDQQIYNERKSKIEKIADGRQKTERLAKKYADDNFENEEEKNSFVEKELKNYDDQYESELNLVRRDKFAVQEAAINQLKKDTGANANKGDTFGDLTNYGSYLYKLLYAPASTNEEATEIINLDKEVEAAIITDLSQRELEKLAGGFYSLKEKEALINKYKLPIIKREANKLESEYEALEQEVNNKTSRINNRQAEIEARLNYIKNSKPEGQFTKEEVDLYNSLVEEFEALNEEKKVYKGEIDIRIKKLSNKKETLEGQYGIDLTKGVLNNNFQLSNDIEKFRETYSGDGWWNGTMDIVGGELIGGLYRTFKAGALGLPTWALTGFGDLFTDQESYSSYDAFRDTMTNFINYDLVSKSESDKFRITKQEGGFADFDARSYAKLGASMVPFTAYLITEVRKGKMTGVKNAVGKYFSRLRSSGPVLTPISAATKNNIIMADAAFKATILDNQKLAEEKGLKGAAASAYAATVSLTEGMVQSIMPDANFIKGAAGKALKDGFVKSLKTAATKEGIKTATKTFATNIAKELGEEEITYLANLFTDVSYGLALPKGSEFLNNQIELVAGTLMLSGGMGSVGAAQTFRAQKQLIYNQIGQNIESTDLYLKTMQENLDPNSLEFKQIQDARRFALDIYKAIEVSPENVTAEQIDLLVDKQKLIDKKKNVDSAFHAEINEQIKNIDEQILNSDVKSAIVKAFDQDIKNLEKSIVSSGVEVDETIVFEGDENLDSNQKQKEFLMNEAGYTEKQAENSKNSPGLFVTTKDGREILVVNKDSALEDSTVTTGQHEFLHKVLKAALNKDPELAKRAATELMMELESMVGGKQNLMGTAWFQRWVRYQEKVKSGTYTVNDFYEEALPLFSEALTNKDIRYNPDTLKRIGDLFRQIMQNLGLRSVSFETGKDVRNFIVDYNKAYQKGKFKGSLKTFAKTGKAKGVKDLKTRINSSGIKESIKDDLQNQLTTLEDQLMDNSIDYDTYERKVNELESKLAKAEKEEVVEKKKPKKKESKKDENLKQATARSKKILDRIGNDPNGYNPNNPKIVEVLSGIIESKSKVFRTAGGNVRNLTNLPGFEMENMIAETIAGMVPLINKFDPKKNDSLFGYLNAQLANKMRGALKSGRVTDQTFTEDVSTAKGITAEETTTKQPEKPKYVKIMDADVFDTKVINAVSDKMVSTVRVLKSKLIAALGKNQNTSPLIAEILSDISTQADIDIKKAMGGKKDGALRKFLLKNKQAIIENSTTTFLMGKDQGDKVLGGLPIAIQKQVDGKFLSYPDWVGKKIDRETTEKRGATAGNQIVRRVPANRISDADYLSFFLQPTGNPIRGRKEALAKELSGEIGLELFVEAIESGGGPIFDAFETNRERMGEVLGDYYAGEVIKQSERGTVKFSIPNNIIRESFKAISGATEFKTEQAIQALYNKYPEFKKQIEKEIVKPYKNLWQRINDLVAKQEAKNKGKAFEIAFSEMVNKIGGKISNVRIEEDGVDVTFEYNGDTIKSELKLTQDAKLGTPFIADIFNFALNDKPINLDWINKEDLNLLNEGLAKNKSNIKKYVERLISLNGVLQEDGSVLIQDGEIDPLYKVEQDIFENSRTNIDITWNTPKDWYGRKGNDILNILQIGAFNLKNNPSSYSAYLPEFATYDGDGNIEKGIQARGIFFSTPFEGKRKIRFKFIFEIKNAKFKNKLAEQSGGIQINTAKGLKNVLEKGAKGKESIKSSNETLFLGGVLSPVKNMKKFDPYEMADIIASELFRDSKKYKNRQKFEYLYKNLTTQEQYQVQKEMRKKNLTPFGRGISVWDFDDTLATTKSNVLYTLPGGITGKLNAEEFAKKGDELLDQGAEFDFSEFEKVMKGAKGPMFEKAMERNKRFGNESVFILTARPANSATAIHEFLKGIGLDIKLENIVGLGNSTAQAKADWVKGMVAEGYNDFYFADDAYKNVKAVQDVLEVADVKSKVQQAKVKFSLEADPKMLDKEFNLMLERTKGVKAGAIISQARAEQLGKGRGRFDLFLPPNAEDFQGLLYKFLGKGKQGDADLNFFKENLFDPFNQAENAMSTFRQKLADNLKILKQELGNIDEDIDAETIKKIEAIGFTPDQAVRVFVWNRLGEEIPDLTKQEKAKILSVVRRDASLMRYARELMKITEQFGGYPPPSKTWFAGNSTSDLYQYANENVRTGFLEQWQANADAIFSPKNMTKIQALYGKDFAKNLKEVLRRMKSGSNRPLNLNDTGSRMLDYINGSVGTIMFLNMRSAVLQTISAVNFINWHDNNIFKAGATLANPKNFVKTFMEIMNSDFLKQRRNGLEINVSEAEIANAVEQSKNKAKAIFSKIIKFGYKPTQFADSFAIAAGGTSFLINRTKTYEKTGLSFKEAREKAFTDFRAIAEENQQSSRTDRTSNIQASNLGRLVFAFNNTPFQMTRLFKKATLDLINGRGDRKTNISKMLYYGAIQNVIFFSLQQAFMAMLFGADEDDKEDIDNRTERLLNSTIDSILRGSGLPGAVISTAKNVIMEYSKQEAKGDWRADHGKTLIQGLNFSPPLGSKASRIYSALKGKKYEKTTFDRIRNQSKIISAITNIPVDRTITKIDNLRVAINEPIETWKRAFLFAGWDQWSLGVYDDLKAIEDKEKGKEKKKSRSEIMKEVWRKRKEEDKKHRDSIINTFRKKK